MRTIEVEAGYGWQPRAIINSPGHVLIIGLYASDLSSALKVLSERVKSEMWADAARFNAWLLHKGHWKTWPINLKYGI